MKMKNRENILLFGGTAESSEIAEVLLAKNCRVTLSTASNQPMQLPSHLNFNRICGKLNTDEIKSYIKEHNIERIICAVHPYAEDARSSIIAAAKSCQIAYNVYLRAESTDTSACIIAQSHKHAAEIAVSLGGNILLTTGSRNLTPYVEATKSSNQQLFARVLDCEESRNALKNAVIDSDHSIFGKGPFTLDENYALLKQHSIKVLVTKDGGAIGGLEGKILAAKKYGAQVVLISRPKFTEKSYNTIEKMITDIFPATT